MGTSKASGQRALASLVLSREGSSRAQLPERVTRAHASVAHSAPNSLRLEIETWGHNWTVGSTSFPATNSLGNSSSTLDFHANGKRAPLGLVEGRERPALCLFLLRTKRAQLRA